MKAQTFTPKHMAVIGAGLAGAVFSQRMIAAGHKVTVFEKSRGTGGRLAACRLGDQSADLGAPGFELNDPDFQNWLSQLEAVRIWAPTHGSFDRPDTLSSSPQAVAIPRQSALTRELLAGAELKTSVRVSSVTATDTGVVLTDDNGEALGQFDQVIVATPAPQAVPLLSASPALQQSAQAADTQPCWLLVIRLAAESGLKADVIEGEHPIFSRLTRDDIKPQRNGAQNPNQTSEVWVLEANSHWSTEQVDESPEAVAEALLAAFEAFIGKSVEIEAQRVHRWLYCRHISASSQTYLWDDARKTAVIGDWLHSDGELRQANGSDAWRSANALADAMLST